MSIFERGYRFLGNLLMYLVAAFVQRKNNR